MKLLKRTPSGLVFGLGVREKTLLERLLAFYPVQPDSRPPLSRETPSEVFSDAEALLHESLADQRKELEGWIHLRLTEGEALSRTGSGWRLALAHGEVEHLLQVLNELRVGSWCRLGSPESLDDASLADSPEGAPFHAIMTIAGQFEMVLLSALDPGDETSGVGPGVDGPAPDGS